VVGESSLQAATPGDAHFGINVNDGDTGGDRILHVAFIGSRSAMQGQKKPGGLLDLADAFDVQMFSALSLNHVFEHSMPITNRGSEGINLCFLDELLRFAGCGELPRQGRGRVMDLRAGTDIADLTFHQSGYLRDTHELALTFGNADYDGQVFFTSCFEHRFQGDQVGYVEMSDGDSRVIGLP